MSHKTPLWAMRQCRFCSAYAHALCQAWNQETNEQCGAPICEAHTNHRLNLCLCPNHKPQGSGWARKTEPNWEPVQIGFFDPPKY